MLKKKYVLGSLGGGVYLIVDFYWSELLFLVCLELVMVDVFLEFGFFIFYHPVDDEAD